MLQGLAGDFLTAAEACELLGVKRETLYAYASRRRIRSYRQGMKRQRLYSREELEKLVGTPTRTDGLRGLLPKAEDWVAYV